MGLASLPEERTFDVLVAGGGMAGVACAISAARCGARVVLCQDRPVLGGNASSEVRMHICGADCSGGRGKALETEIREGGIMEEIRLETSVRNPQRSASMLDLILYEKCRTEPNLCLMLNTTITGVVTEENRITHALADRQSTEQSFKIAAKVFVDCTGDGRLGAEAAAHYYMGRESRALFNETMAPEEGDSKTLGSSLLFMARDMGRPMPFTAPAWARKFTEEDLKFRAHGKPGVDRGLEYGYWWIEWGGCLNTIQDNEQIRDELLAILLGVWDHVKNGGDHGAANWALDWFGFLPGKRENRRFVGHYMLMESDLVSSRPFDDAIAYGGWSLDLHPVEGIDAPDQHPCDQRSLDFVYDIPLRACISMDARNLMFAGRNISASHVAFGSTRVMATCAVMGQGVGAAAAYAVAHDMTPAAIPSNPQALQAIQQRLLRDDVYLIGRVNLDPSDLAREASITASSAQENGAAVNIISGQTRAVHGPKGAPPDRALPGTHRWMSDPGAGLPAWIELTWTRPITPKEIRIVFDSGLHRALTLTHSDAYAERMEWGKPQPETVRDYRIEAKGADGLYQTIAEAAGNYQRLRVHEVKDASLITSIRLSILSTNGIDHARVAEIRVY